MTLWTGLVLFLAGCAPTTATRSQPAPLDYSVVAGTWKGTVAQSDAQAVYTVRLTLLPAPLEDGIVGSSDYPSLECGGDLVAVRRDGTTAVVREVLSYGQDECIDNVLLYLTANPDGTLAYAFYNTDMTTPEGVATLTKLR